MPLAEIALHALAVWMGLTEFPFRNLNNHFLKRGEVFEHFEWDGVLFKAPTNQTRIKKLLAHDASGYVVGFES
jgi:hypothetical protein